MAVSKQFVLRWAATMFGTIFLGFGTAYIAYPREAFSTFGLPSPTTTTDLETMDAVVRLFGAKDFFAGFAILTSTWLGNRKTAGLIVLAGSLCAAFDGFVVKTATGTGEWNHWGYGSVMGVVGLLMTGLLG